MVCKNILNITKTLETNLVSLVVSYHRKRDEAPQTPQPLFKRRSTPMKAVILMIVITTVYYAIGIQYLATCFAA